ncbi:DUF4139 domain-containing protein [Denitrobaculum tricleocarpae]|uniref:DUF4139 domain-containing protein n=1 Tax=Denitrobaculum tricleocarpae TaxID=2591009 RepID=A0A545U1A7_9PROT|nr:DUF4139 domain-containing protein [Denitrobaculum tricleocarpae]TQV83262.1 DUF4139 domain-containing protein [Denitrobaculum tricleocarpae]
MTGIMTSARRAGITGAVAGVLVTTLAAASLAAEVRVGEDARSTVSLTVYNQDLALISETRRIDLPSGQSKLAVVGLPASLLPQTARIGGEGFRVLEQSFDANLVSQQRLLEASVGQDVRVIRTHPTTGEETLVTARLISVSQGIVLQIGDRIETSVPGRIVFDRIPEGLREKPTLVTSIESQAGGESELALRYLTGGLSWSADYVAELNEAEDRLDLSAMVTLRNNTTSRFEDAALRLVAGQVNLRTHAPADSSPAMMMRSEAKFAGAAEADMSAPQSVSDRYVYDLARPVAIGARETKQISLLSADGVAVAKSYRFDGLASAHGGANEIGPVNASITLEIENGEETGLGLPLPAGVVRVYQADRAGSLFLGEDSLSHTPKGEKAELRLGDAFDITARAKHTAVDRISRDTYESEQEIVVENAKGEAVSVEVAGFFPQGWKMLTETSPHEKETANQVVWKLEVPAGGSTALTYRVRVSRQ